MNWSIERSELFERRLKKYRKKHKAAVKQVLSNLEDYLSALQEGVDPYQFQAGFYHAEPHGIRAIDQKGAKTKLTETRLYLYPDKEQKILHLVTIAGKQKQQIDINECKSFVEKIKKGER
jgi:mRNA-degrading endonuclease RelE of RelBE toxin-antitoxin system